MATIQQGQATRVIQQLNIKSKLEQTSARNALTDIFTSLKLLARQGLALRGSDVNQGNLFELLKLRAEDNSDLAWWLKRVTDEPKNTRHLLGHDIQNEMLKDISHAILRKILEQISNSKCFSIFCDGTQDISCQEQESISVRYVDEEMYPREVFLGLYETTDTSGKSIANILFDVMTRLSLQISNLRGQVVDGASNMSGAYNGAQALILEKQPLAYYTHCSAHCINLVAQSVATIPLIRDAMSIVNELGVLFSRTIKFRNILKSIGSNEGITSKTLWPLCPTRWTVRQRAIQELLDSYSLIRETLDSFLKLAGISHEQKAKAAGLLRSLDRGETVLALKIAATVFGNLEKLVKVSSARDATLSGILQGKEVITEALQIERDNFSETFKKCCDTITEMNLQEMTSPRPRKVPKRISGQAESFSASTVEEHYRIIIIEVYDTAIQQLKTRFDESKSGLASYLMLSSCWKTDAIFDDSSDVTSEICKYPELDLEVLRSEIKVLAKKLETRKSLDDVVSFLREASQEFRSLFPNFEAVLRLVLVRPYSSVECERSFSALRRLKTWLRSTMTQTRLNSVAIIHVHQTYCDQVDVNKLITEFVSRNDWRITTFGEST